MKRDDNGFPIPRKQFTIMQDHGESSYSFQVFSTDEVAKEFSDLFKEAEGDIKGHIARVVYDRPCEDCAIDTLIATLSPLRASDNGPGRWFRSAPTIKIGKRNIVIRQFAGLDI